MNYMFLDTETNGLPNDYKGLIPDSNNWPRVVQLGYVVTNEHGTILKEQETIIKPQGWDVGRTDIHGISQEQAEKEGIERKAVLLTLTAWMHACEALICHNVDFDLPILQAEFYRDQLGHPYHGKMIFCTMKQTAAIVGIRKKRRTFNQGDYKWPSLKELAEYCNVEHQGTAHTALADAKTTMKCFWKISDLIEDAFTEPYYYFYLHDTPGHRPLTSDECKSYII